jgi:hypothetical protein
MPVPTVGSRRQAGKGPAPPGYRLHARGQWPLDEGFLDAFFTGVKKGARGRSHQGRQSYEDPLHLHRSQLPLAFGIQSASPHESQLVEGAFGQKTLVCGAPLRVAALVSSAGIRWEYQAENFLGMVQLAASRSR